MRTMIGEKSNRRLRRIATHGNVSGPTVWFLLLALLVAGCDPGVPRPQLGADGIGDAYALLQGNGGYGVQAYDLAPAWDSVGPPW